LLSTILVILDSRIWLSGLEMTRLIFSVDAMVLWKLTSCWLVDFDFGLYCDEIYLELQMERGDVYRDRECNTVVVLSGAKRSEKCVPDLMLVVPAVRVCVAGQGNSLGRKHKCSRLTTC
jgi:hypothetical protein